jgi:hypothetical protein
VERFKTTPSTLSAVIVEHCHGAITRITSDTTAFPLRANLYHLEILGFWDSADEDEANLNWVRDFFIACGHSMPARFMSIHWMRVKAIACLKPMAAITTD